MQDELRVLEEEEGRAMKTVEELQRSAYADAGAHCNKKNFETLKKLKVHLQFELEDLVYSKSRTVALCADPEDLDLWATWSTKVDALEDSTNSLKQRIKELEGLGQEVNQDTLDALETLKDIKEKVKNSNAEIAKKRKIIQQLRTPSCRPIFLNPSRVMVQVDMDKDDHPPQSIDHQLDGYIKLCALYSKGFSHKDVILAPSGCNYHPWCCITQN